MIHAPDASMWSSAVMLGVSFLWKTIIVKTTFDIDFESN